MTAAKAERTGIVTTRPLIARPGVWLTWFVVIFFFVNLAGLVGSVVVSSLPPCVSGKYWWIGSA